jgi:hypothetical protein
MKATCLAVALPLAGLHAAEVSLYDCDYTNSPSIVGQSIPLTSAPLPGHEACGEIVFGGVIVENASSPWIGTSAMMRPLDIGSVYFTRMESQVRTLQRAPSGQLKRRWRSSNLR